MRKSILKNTLFVVATALCLMLVFAACMFDIRLTNQNTQSMQNTASAFALSYNENEDVEKQVKQMQLAATGLRITIIAADGTVLADTNADVSNMPNHLNREEIKLARAAKKGVSVRASETLGEKLVYAAARTDSGAYVRIATEQTGFLHDVLSLLPWLILAAIVSMLVATILARKFASSLSKPLIQLGESLKSVKDGEVALEPNDYPYAELSDMAVDINEISKEISNSLKRLEGEKARIDFILDNMQEGFAMLDCDDTILLINSAACNAFMCDKNAVRGKNMLHATRNIKLLDAIAQTRNGSGQCTLPIALGASRQGEAHISTVADESGIIIIISDVTERHNAAKMRQEFFQSASHELKTPITSIQGFAELLSDGITLDDEKLSEIYKRIAKETARMGTLINDIIMISRLESGDLAFENEPLDVGAVIAEICNDAKAQAAQNDITIVCNADSAIRSISRRELEELTGNLIQNAIKYNKPGGRVEVRLKAENKALVLSVFNTGEPIAPEYRTRIFERFFRIDKGRSKAAGGTGLGLAIVKHIASRLNASIALNVSEDGNTFVITM